MSVVELMECRGTASVGHDSGGERLGRGRLVLLRQAGEQPIDIEDDEQLLGRAVDAFRHLAPHGRDGDGRRRELAGRQAHHLADAVDGEAVELVLVLDHDAHACAGLGNPEAEGASHIDGRDDMAAHVERAEHRGRRQRHARDALRTEHVVDLQDRNAERLPGNRHGEILDGAVRTGIVAHDLFLSRMGRSQAADSRVEGAASASSGRVSSSSVALPAITPLPRISGCEPARSAAKSTSTMSIISSTRIPTDRPPASKTRTGWLPLSIRCTPGLAGISGMRPPRYWTTNRPSDHSIVRAGKCSRRWIVDSGTAFGAPSPARNSSRAWRESAGPAAALASSGACAVTSPIEASMPLGSRIMMTLPSPRMVLPEKAVIWRSSGATGFTTISSASKTRSTSTPKFMAPTCSTTT